MFNPSFKGKKVLVMGLGFFGGGVGVTKFLVKQGAWVTVTDIKTEKDLRNTLKSLKNIRGIKYHLGGHKESDFKDSDLIIVNPSVPADSPYLAKARKHKIPFETEMNLFFKYCPARIIGITGSNGKTTTTALLGEMLNAQFPGSIWVGGNIGRGSLLEKIDRISANDLVVLELSSFQLDDLSRIKRSPFISVVTNIQSNHLDRHKTMANYINAKKNILRFQDSGSVAILNNEDSIVRPWGKHCVGSVLFFSRNKSVSYGAFVKGNKFYYRLDNDNPKYVCRTSDTLLPGDFNHENIVAAISAAAVLGVSAEVMARSIKSFKGVEHRLEFVREFKGVKYYNDSIATNPDSTIVALNAIKRNSNKKSTILIAGGYDKKLPFNRIAKYIAKEVKSLILLGATAPIINKAVKQNGMPDDRIQSVASFKDAVKLAHRLAVKGDTVLLSPACASYDMFNNYTERGNLFKSIVAKL